MLCALFFFLFDCSGRRLVDVVQVQVAHVRCPGSRPHLKGQRMKSFGQTSTPGHVKWSVNHFVLHVSRNTPAVVGQSYPHCLGPLL